VGCLWLP